MAYRKEIQFWKNYTPHKCYFHCLNVTEVMDGDGQFHTLVPVAKDKRWFGLIRVRKTVTHLVYNSTAFFTTHPFINCIAANAGVSFFAAPQQSMMVIITVIASTPAVKPKLDAETKTKTFTYATNSDWAGNTNLLLTERESRTGEYWPEVVAVQNRPRANISQYGSSKLG